MIQYEFTNVSQAEYDYETECLTSSETVHACVFTSDAKRVLLSWLNWCGAKILI